MEGAGGYANSLYENTNGVSVIFNKRAIGAHTGTYNQALVDKCCSICSSGSYAGVSYNFHSDSGSSTAASCVAFELKFIDDASLGTTVASTRRHRRRHLSLEMNR